MNRKVMIIAGCTFAVLAALTLVVFAAASGGKFTVRKDSYTFVRDLSAPGTPFNVATDGTTRLDAVFAENNMERYGADGSQPDGVGLHVDFVTTIGNRRVSDRTFDIVPWTRPEQEDLPVRDKWVRVQKRAEFNRLARAFAGPVATHRVYPVVLDTTNGVDAKLASRVLASIGVLCKDGGTVILYQLTSDWYQGAPPRVDCGNPDTGTVQGWLAVHAAANSSVLGGLRGVMNDIARAVKEDPTVIVHAAIFTDGLENTAEVNLYQQPTLVTEPGNQRDTLDPIFGVAGLDLRGVEVTLHPLPQANPSDKRTMDAALGYIADRLRSDQASVGVESN